MIRFDLRCASGHGFDGWFRSSQAFETQVGRDLVGCPHCGTTKVEKALMAPAVAGTRKSTDADGPTPMAAGLPPEKSAEFHAHLVRMTRELRKGSQDVGPRFAEEARRIHFGETEERRIHGQASASEVKALAEEGVPFLPLPVLPEDRH